MFAHWGTFTKQASLSVALGIAEDALRAHGFQAWDTAADGDYLVIGGNDQVIVTIVCVPQSTDVWIVVNACSADSVAAETARNQVRQTIVDTVQIDPGTVLIPANG